MGASQNYKDICCYYNLRGQGSYGSWKTWKVLEFKYFSFRAWKAKSWNLVVGHGKSWKIVVCVVRKLLQVSQQGQYKIQASYVRKYLRLVKQVLYMA